MTESVELVLGALFVFFHARARFNDPIHSRSTTTVVRYYTAAVSYYVLALGLYVFLTFFPEFVQTVLGFTNTVHAATGGDATEKLPLNTFYGLSTPLVAALVLTVLLPRLPVLSVADDWIRKYFQHLAAIPHEARRLSAELRKSPFRVNGSVQERVVSRLTRASVAKRDILFDDAVSPQQRWSRITALIVQLEEQWETDNRYAGFMATFSVDYKALNDRYQVLLPRAAKCFRLMKERSGTPGDERVTEAVEECVRNFIDSSERLYRSVCDFISRGVLQCNVTSESRTRRLKELGFQIDKCPHRTLTANQVLTVFTVVFIILLGGFTLLGHAYKTDFEATILLVALISVNYAVAVACAVIPKAGWAFANRNASGDRPVGFYLLAGTVAVIIGVPVGFLFRLLTYQDFDDTVLRLSYEYPWYIMTFFTAVITAYQVDNRFDNGRFKSEWIRRLIGAGAQGGCTVLVALFVVGYALPAVAADSQVTVDIPPLPGPLIINGAIALFIGFCIPTWYRRAADRAEHDIAEEDEDAPDLVVHHLRHY